jgi:hypothetical protein
MIKHIKSLVKIIRIHFLDVKEIKASVAMNFYGALLHKKETIK